MLLMNHRVTVAYFRFILRAVISLPTSKHSSSFEVVWIEFSSSLASNEDTELLLEAAANSSE